MNFPAKSFNLPDVTMPVNFEAEQQILGSMMMDNRLFGQVAAFLEERHFASPLHGRIYQICRTLIERGDVANPLTMRAAFSEDAELREMGGDRYLVTLCGAASRVGTDDMGRQVVDMAERRDIILSALEAIDDAQSVDIKRGAGEVAATLMAGLSKLGTANTGFTTLGDALSEVLDDLTSDISKVVHPTGMRRLDSALGGGLYGGKFYGVSARHKVGKTSLLLSMSYSLLFNGPKPVPHLYICMEMGAKEISQRLLARRLEMNCLAFLEMATRKEAYVNGVWMTRDKLAEQIKSIRHEFDGKGLTFQQRPRLSLESLRATLAQAAMSGKYAGVIVDYLQLVTGQRKGQSGAEHLDDVAQSLVETAKQYGLWVIAAAQLNREGFVRGGDGLMNACDMAFVLNRKEDGNGGLSDDAWLEMSASRYTPYRHLGEEDNPGLRLNTKIGPFFEEL